MINSVMLLAENDVEVSNFCSGAHTILELVGWVLTIFKVAIPLIIIALGLFDLGKAAISSKPEEIKKSAISIVWRLVGGIAIFFVPTIIMLVTGWIGGFEDAANGLGTVNITINGTTKEYAEWDVCYDCIISPWSDVCQNVTSEYDGY